MIKRGALTVPLQIVLPTVLCIGTIFVLHYRVGALEEFRRDSTELQKQIQKDIKDNAQQWLVIKSHLDVIDEKISSLRNDLLARHGTSP